MSETSQRDTLPCHGWCLKFNFLVACLRRFNVDRELDRLHCQLPRVVCAHWIVDNTTPGAPGWKYVEAHRKRFATFYSSIGLLEPHDAYRLAKDKPLGDSLSHLLLPEKQGEYSPVTGGTLEDRAAANTASSRRCIHRQCACLHLCAHGGLLHG